MPGRRRRSAPTSGTSPPYQAAGVAGLPYCAGVAVDEDDEVGAVWWACTGWAELLVEAVTEQRGLVAQVARDRLALALLATCLGDRRRPGLHSRGDIRAVLDAGLPTVLDERLDGWDQLADPNDIDGHDLVDAALAGNTGTPLEDDLELGSPLARAVAARPGDRGPARGAAGAVGDAATAPVTGRRSTEGGELALRQFPARPSIREPGTTRVPLP
jgi:hypothetical protein